MNPLELLGSPVKLIDHNVTRDSERDGLKTIQVGIISSQAPKASAMEKVQRPCPSSEGSGGAPKHVKVWVKICSVLCGDV